MMGFFKSIEKNARRAFYNKRHGTRIKSNDVSGRALIGVNTSVGVGSCIDSNCVIGSQVYIGRNCYITKAVIGSYCSIANNVTIGPGEHPFGRASTNSLFYEDSYSELTRNECIIGNDVWIGSDAIILRGVTIGDGAIIGANAVVTKDVSDFEIVAGVPATHLKYRFSKDDASKIKKTKWWDQEVDVAREIVSHLDLHLLAK